MFSPTSHRPGSELQLIMAMAEIMRTLYGAIFQDYSSVCAHRYFGCPLNHRSTDTPQDQHEFAREDLRTLLGYMATYFPFRPDTITNRDIKVSSIVLVCGSRLLTRVSPL